MDALRRHLWVPSGLAEARAGSGQVFAHLEQVRHQIHFGSCVHPKIGPGLQRGKSGQEAEISTQWFCSTPTSPQPPFPTWSGHQVRTGHSYGQWLPEPLALSVRHWEEPGRDLVVHHPTLGRQSKPPCSPSSNLQAQPYLCAQVPSTPRESWLPAPTLLECENLPGKGANKIASQVPWG